MRSLCHRAIGGSWMETQSARLRMQEGADTGMKLGAVKEA
jgi:hypothetical protein